MEVVQMKKNIRKSDIKKQRLAKSRKGGAKNAGMVNGKLPRKKKNGQAHPSQITLDNFSNRIAGFFASKQDTHFGGKTTPSGIK